MKRKLRNFLKMIKILSVSFFLFLIGLNGELAAFETYIGFGGTLGKISSLNDSTADIEGTSTGVDFSISGDFDGVALVPYCLNFVIKNKKIRLPVS